MICMKPSVSRFPSSVWMLCVCNIVFCYIHPHKRLCLKKCWSVKVLRGCAPPSLLFFFFFTIRSIVLYWSIVLKQVFEARLWTQPIALYLKLFYRNSSKNQSQCQHMLLHIQTTFISMQHNRDLSMTLEV